FQIPAKNTETAYITVPLSIIILNIVGAPTFLRSGPPLSSFRIFLNLKLTTDHLKPLKSNYSRTSAKCARKSNHSRTYAKTGGWGCLRQRSSPATLLFSMATLTTQLSTIVGAPTFPFQHTVCRKQRRGRKPRSTDRNVCATRRGTQKPGRSGSICGRALEQDGIGSRDLRRGDLHEAVLLGNGKGARKVLGGDVALGFRNEEICLRFERASDSGEKGRARGNFVYHGEQKGEINCPGERLEARRVLAAKARVNLLGDSRLLCPLFEPRKHLLLHVNADDLSRGPDHLCQWNAEEAHRAAEIQYGHSFLHVRSEDCARILPELSDRAGKKVAEPPRANPVSGFLCIIHRCCPPSLTTDSVRQSCK